MTDPKPRPDFTGPMLAAVDWLAANGIDEYLPEQPEITITVAADGTGTIEYSSFNWSGPRGWDLDNIALDADDTGATRTVPLVVLPSEEVRQALDAAGAMTILRGADEVDEVQP